MQRFLILLLLLDSGLCFSQSTNQVKRLDYTDFRIVTDRNIFNPRRYRSSRQPVREVSRVDSFTLVGTMAYEKGPFAFFEGTSSDFRKVLKPADTIAGYRVTNIGFNSVKLADQTNEVQLAVGMQMRREENGPWHLASAADITAPARPGPETAAPAGAKPGENASPAAGTTDASASTADQTATAQAAGADDPVLRRLMQRREQEITR